MRWRTIDEVKAGKGGNICANIACGRTEGLEEMEVVFNYAEDGKAKNVLVKCVLCQRCEKKMHRVRDKGRERKPSESGERHSQDKETHKETRHHNREHGSSRHRETKRRRKDGPNDKSERQKRRPALESPESKSVGGEV
jgi:protein FRA10AC1